MIFLSILVLFIVIDAVQADSDPAYGLMLGGGLELAFELSLIAKYFNLT